MDIFIFFFTTQKQIFSSKEEEGSFSQHPLFSSLKIAIKKVNSKIFISNVKVIFKLLLYITNLCFSLLCNLHILIHSYLITCLRILSGN